MIVRNGAATLADCLRSVSALCEELIVVDTGSSDDSAAIARSFGAKVVQTAWKGDFSAARNVYLEHARCSWLLCLDADEVLGELPKAAFIEGLERYPETAFMFRIRNYFPKDCCPEPTLPSKLSAEAPAGMGCMITKTIRLFPRMLGIEYCYPVHESLLPAIRRQSVRVRQCAIPIHHNGYVRGTQGLREKVTLYRTLGERKIADFPGYFLGYIELGKVYLYEGRLHEAESMFASAIRLQSKCAEAHCLLAMTLIQQGRHAESGDLLKRARHRFSRNGDVLYMIEMLDRELSGEHPA